MSELALMPDRFWQELKSDVAESLSDEQRNEINRVLSATSSTAKKNVSDLRLSFKWFFVRLAWGPEKRSSDRIKKEQAEHPVLATRNLPLLASLYVGFTALTLVAIGASALLLHYFVF